MRGKGAQAGKLINGKTLEEWAAHHAAKRAKSDPRVLVDHIPMRPWTRALGLGEEQNKTSHEVITDAGCRTNAEGNTFRAWHSPNVKTEPAIEDGYTLFGFEPLRRRVKEPRAQTRKRATQRKTAIRRNSEQVVRSGAEGEWDEPVIETETVTEYEQPVSGTDAVTNKDADADEQLKKKLTSHAAYMVDKEESEAHLNRVYEWYKADRAPARVVYVNFDRFIRMKAATQRDLRHMRGDETIEDHLQNFLHADGGKLWQKIEAKGVEGPLSHYVNSAFKRHFGDANKQMKKEWSWNRFLAGQVGAENDAERWSEIHANAGHAYGAFEAGTDDPTLVPDRPQPQPEPQVKQGKSEQRESERKPYPWEWWKQQPELPQERGPFHQIPLRTRRLALGHFRRKHPSGRERKIFEVWLKGFRDDRKITGKEIAAQLGISEFKVSRARKRIEDEIVSIAKAITAKKEVGAR